MREWFHQHAPDVVQRTELPIELRENQPRMRLFLRGVVHDMFDRLLDDWTQSSTSVNQTPRSHSSKRSNMDGTPSDRTSNSTPLTVPSTGTSALPSGHPLSPCIQQGSSLPLSPESLRYWDNTEDLGNEKEVDQDLPQLFDAEPINQPYPGIVRSVETEDLLSIWTDVALQDDFEFNVFTSSHVPGILGSHEFPLARE